LFLDETYVKVAGRWFYLYRAIDQHGPLIDVLLSAKRELPTARAFFASPSVSVSGCLDDLEMSEKALSCWS
jgi:transposase-like protein